MLLGFALSAAVCLPLHLPLPISEVTYAGGAQTPWSEMNSKDNLCQDVSQNNYGFTPQWDPGMCSEDCLICTTLWGSTKSFIRYGHQHNTVHHKS